MSSQNGSQTPEQIERDIVAQREQLARTVDQLGTKLDAKAQAKAKAAELKDRATDAHGNPRPEVLGAGAGAAGLALALLAWRRARKRR